MHRILLVALFAAIGVAAQTPTPTATPRPDVWKPLRILVGTWEGTGTGQPGTSKVKREYKFTLNDKFIQVTHRSTYAPQEKNPKGEVHDDLGFMSWDKARKQFVFRQFHVETFVIQYLVTSISEDGKTIVMESEAIENVPKGMRSRETWKFLSADEFTETFEISMSGKEFEVYSENKFKRKK